MAPVSSQTASPSPPNSPSAALAPVRQGYGVTQLAQMLQTAIQTQINGQLVLKSHSGESWVLYFRVGRLFWASGGSHAMRRWRRLLKQFCKISPDSLKARIEDMPPLWEHWLLNTLIKRQQILRPDAAALIERTIQDVLFDILHASHSIRHIAPMGDATVNNEEPISILSTAEMLNRAQTELTQWFSLGLMSHSPDGAPRVIDPQTLRQQVPPKLAQALTSLATGKASLRELATITRQTPIAMGNLMAPSIQKGLIELVELPDIPHPHRTSNASKGSQSRSAKANSAPGSGQTGQSNPARSPQAHSPVSAPSPAVKAPVILCVDDSAQVSFLLEQVLQPAGYQFIGIQDSVEALSAILKHKPDLLFLDLIMPLVYGNEICTQIRRAPAYRELPIIMLSSNARMLDRLQAKGAGATDFMSKPIEAAKVLAVIEKYLGPAPTAAAPVALPA